MQLRRSGWITWLTKWAVFATAALALPITAQVCHAPGINAGGTISGVVNSYYQPGASVSAGATTLALGTLRAGGGPAVAAGDLLLIVQMQGANFDSSNNNCYGDGLGSCTNTTTTADPARGYKGTPSAGTYEYARVTGISGGNATLASGLLNAYSLAAPTVSSTNASGSQTFQIIRVPQYPAITVDSANPVLPLAWNGSTGGVIALDVAGTSTFTGAATHMNASGYGFRGGWGSLGSYDTTSSVTDYARPAQNLALTFDTTKGEGIAGTPRHVWSSVNNAGTTLLATDGYPGGDFGRGAPANAGGGGQMVNSGGGGGGNGGRGGNGGFTWSGDGTRDVGAMGGAAYPQSGAAIASSLVMGGGGGAGDLNGGGAEPAGESVGASGGGMIFFSSGAINGTARLLANGANGADGYCDGGGGGGAGGSIRLVVGAGASNISAAANGGSGGNQPGCPNHGSAAGGGGGGVIFSNATLAASTVAAGTAGVDITGGVWNGGIGSVGQTNAAASTSWPGWNPGHLCLPAISVTKTAITPTVTTVTGATAQYRITASNAATAGAARNLELLDLALPPGWTYLSTNAITYTLAPPAAAGSFATGADTALNGSGYAIGTTVASNPTAGSNAPTWGSFFVAPGGQIDITFTVSIPDAASVGTYHNPAAARFVDPTTNTVQKVTPATNNGANRTSTTYGSAGVCTTVGACTYALGTAVAGNNNSGLEAGPSADNVTLPVDWSISKTLVGSAAAGQTANYVITPRNNGRTIATQTFAISQASTVSAANIPSTFSSSPLRITDTLPSGVTLSALAAGSNWTCSGAVGASSLSCDYFAATPSAAYPVAAQTNLPATTVTVFFSQAACPGPVTNTAAISAGALENTTADNTTTLASALGCGALLSITKTNSVTTLAAGSTTSYSVTVNNAGPSSADGAVLKDLPSAGLVCTAASCNPANTTGGASCPSPLTIALLQGAGTPIPVLPPNSSVLITIDCQVTATGLP